MAQEGTCQLPCPAGWAFACADVLWWSETARTALVQHQLGEKRHLHVFTTRSLDLDSCAAVIMRRTSQLRQAARQFAGVVSTTTHSTPVAAASRPTLTFVSARTPRGQEHVCCRPSRVVSARHFTTTPTRPDGESLPKSLTTEQDLDYGTELVAQVDDTHYRPPPVVSQAESVEDVTDPTYVPATIADGLKRVGGLDGWWDKSENYKTAFASFKPRRKILDPIALRLVLRRAVIEAFALRQCGLDAMLTSSWPVGGPQQLRRVLAVTVDSNGRLSGDMQAITADLQSPETYGRAPLSVKSLLSRAEGIEDSAWESVPLPDDTIKFAVSPD